MRLRTVVSDVIGRLQAGFDAKKIRVFNNIPDSLPPLQADQAKFDRLFELLLKDEIVSLPEGKDVTLTARVITHAADKPPDIEVELRDNGPGLPQEALRLIFDPFAVRSDSPRLSR